MAIEWAPVSVDGERNPAARRHARSLAMRQFRKRQRDGVDRDKMSTSDGAGSGDLNSAKRPSKRGAPNPHLDQSGDPKARSLVFKALPWRNHAETRIQDPRVMAESLLLCKQYLQWLRPEEQLTDVDFALFVAHQDMPDPLLIAASYLVASRYLDAAQFRAPGKDYVERKNEILASLNGRLLDKEKPISADVINAIVSLLHFELCEGNEEALVHLQGLNAMMSARENDRHLFTSCTMNLEMGDLIHSLMSSRPTELVPLAQQNPFLEPRYSSYHVPILTQELGQMKNLVVGPGITRVDFMMHSVSNFIERSFDSPAVQQVGPSFDNIADSNNAVVDAQDQVSDYSLFVQAGKAASVIIYRYAVRRHAVNDNENQALATAVIHAMTKMPNKQWEYLKYFRLFLLLTAICASKERSRRSFCEAHLVRGILQIGPEAWIDTRKFIVKYLDNVNAVRRP